MDTSKIDKFWNEPEGKFTKLINWGLLIGAGILFFKFSSEIAAFFSNLLTIVITLFILATIGYCVWDDDIRTRFLVAYKGFMKNLAKKIISVDRIATLEACLQIMKDKLAKIGKHITELNGQKYNFDALIKKKQSEIEDAFEKASLAKETHNEAQMQSKTRMAMMSKAATNDYILLRNQMDVILRVLKKMESSCQIIIDETAHNLKVTKEKYEFITKGHKTIKGAMSIIVSSKEKEIFNETLEDLEKDMNMKVGEMDRIMDMSKSVIESIDLNNMLMDKKGLDALEAWEQQADQIFKINPQPQVIQIPADNSSLNQNKYGLNF